jgi:Beta/Gamma crystallin
MPRSTVIAYCAAVAFVALGAAGVSAFAADGAKKSPAKKGLLILYNGQKFQGDYLEIKKARTSMGEDMRVGSIAVFPGESWEICEGARFKGPCRIVTTDEMGLGSVMINSVRPAKQPAPAK